MIGKRVESLAPHYRCPSCSNTPLIASDGGYGCDQCGSVYPIKNGCPIFLDKSSLVALENELSTESGQRMLAEYEAFSSTKGSGFGQSLVRLITPPQVLYDYNPDLSKSHTRLLFNHKGSSTSVLNVGGGPRRYTEHEITINLRPFKNVDIVGDAHNIPFADNVFDTVICNAVLEHVFSPEQVVSEMFRVLKPGGLLYAEVPFIFFFHGYPNDFKRYTREGIKRLFGMLVDTQVGMTQGPISSAIQCWNIALESLIPPRFYRSRKVFNGLFRWTFFWFKYLDKFIQNNPEAHRVAGGFYVLGSKQAKPDARGI
jgi:SAM-dependent methyltransferase